MNSILRSLLIMVQLYTLGSCSTLQKASVNNWRIGGEIPPLEGQKQSPGVAGPVTGTVHDLLLIGGGANFPDSMPWMGGKKKYYDDIFTFCKVSNGHFELYKKGKLPFAVAYPACTTTPAGVVSAGGENEQGISKRVLLLRWNQEADSLEVSFMPDLPQPLTNAAATSTGNVVYLAGGETAGGVSQKFYRLDLDHAAAGWVPLPDLPKPASHAVAVAQFDGKRSAIYVIGGRKKITGSTSELYTSVFQYAPERNAWYTRRPLPYPLSAGTGLALDHQIVLFGGDRGETFHQVEERIAAIAREGDARRKEILNEEKKALQSHHPGFSREVLWYDTRKDVWKADGTIPFETPVTTTAVKWHNEVVIPSGEIRAGVRTPNILAGRMEP